MDSEAWHSVLEFSLQAWPIVKATPSWSTAKHNAVKNSCFKFLSSNCLKALKSHSWTASEKSSFRERYSTTSIVCPIVTKQGLNDLGWNSFVAMAVS